MRLWRKTNDATKKRVEKLDAELLSETFTEAISIIVNDETIEVARFLWMREHGKEALPENIVYRMIV